MKKVSVENTILKYVFLPYVLCYLILWLLPVEANIPNSGTNFLLNITFVFLIVTVSLFIDKIFSSGEQKNKSLKKMTVKKMKFIICLSTISSFLGLLLIAYDRIFIRGINYQNGLRAARYDWKATTGGSIFGFFGNLLINSAYISIIMLILNFDKMCTKERNICFLVSSISIFGFGALNGGRSNIFFMFAFLIVSLVIRKTLNGKKIRLKKRAYFIIVLFSVFAIIFCLMMFASSANMNKLNFKTQAQLGINELYGKTGETFAKIKNPNDLRYLIIYAFSYIIHGQWTAETIFSFNNFVGDEVFYLYKDFLHGFGILKHTPIPSYIKADGVFLSFPGALYYDYNILGVIFGSIFLGCLLGWIITLLRRPESMTGIKLLITVYTLLVIILSPFFFALGFIYVNFAIFDFLVIILISDIKFGKTSWLLIE